MSNSKGPDKFSILNKSDAFKQSDQYVKSNMTRSVNAKSNRNTTKGNSSEMSIEDQKLLDLGLDQIYDVNSIPPSLSVTLSHRDSNDTANPALRLQLRKTIMVGSDFQAIIPDGLTKYADKLPNKEQEKLVWSPHFLSQKQIEDYLSKCQRHFYTAAVGVDSIPRGCHTRDDEQALYMLHSCNYDVEKAFHEYKLANANIASNENTKQQWSEDECKNFESGIRLYGKDFYLIQLNKVKTRSIGDLVQFYYLWKKTERHDVFANRAALEKKKYSLHPGVTFLEDYTDGESAKDGSFTNIQCLIYGDSKKFHRGTNLTNNSFSEHKA